MSSSSADLVILSSASSRQEIVAALIMVNSEAGRVPHIVGTAKVPSKWDRLHRTINTMLDLLDRAA